MAQAGKRKWWQTVLLWIAVAIGAVIFLGPITGPVMLNMEVEATFIVPGGLATDISCGSVLSPEDDSAVQGTVISSFEYKAECDRKLGTYRAMGYAVIPIGGACWLYLAYAYFAHKKTPKDVLAQLQGKAQGTQTAKATTPKPAVAPPGQSAARVAAPSPAFSTPAPAIHAPPVGPPGEARWAPDPTGRHQDRYWDGSTWTKHVHDGTGAETTTDPYP